MIDFANSWAPASNFKSFFFQSLEDFIWLEFLNFSMLIISQIPVGIWWRWKPETNRNVVFLKEKYIILNKWLTNMKLLSDFSCWLNFQTATNQKRGLCFRKSEILHIIDLVTLQQANVFIPGVHANQTFINVCPICWNQQYRVETCTAVLPQYIKWTVRP